MRKLIKTGLTAALVAFFGSPVVAQDSGRSALTDILESGTLMVGTTGDWNPMSVRNPATNTFEGYDIDVMKQLAADLDVELEFVPTDWKTLVNGAVAGNYHLTGSASISPARMKAAGFSESYIDVEILPFTTADKIDRFDGWDSIDQPDVKVAATLGTTFERQVKAWFPNADIKIVEAPALGHQEVISGRADVFVTSNIEGSTLVTKFPNVRQIQVEEPRSKTPIAMILPQGDQVWINYVNNWIKLRKSQGFFDEVAARWGLN